MIIQTLFSSIFYPKTIFPSFIFKLIWLTFGNVICFRNEDLDFKNINFFNFYQLWKLSLEMAELYLKKRQWGKKGHSLKLLIINVE